MRTRKEIEDAIEALKRSIAVSFGTEKRINQEYVEWLEWVLEGDQDV